MPMLPWPVWPLAEHARLGQNTVVGSMTVLLVVLGSMPRGVCLDPRFLYKYASPRLNAELPCALPMGGSARRHGVMVSSAIPGREAGAQSETLPSLVSDSVLLHHSHK